MRKRPTENLESTILSELFTATFSKSDRRKLQIIESTIECLAVHGIEKTTYDTIATWCKITRPLVQHYFPDSQLLYELCWKFIRGNAQQFSLHYFKDKKGGEEHLEGYLDSLFDWSIRFRSHSVVWLLFQYKSSYEDRFLKLNTAYSEFGRARIEALLNKGKLEGTFHCRSPYKASLMIQSLLLGSLTKLVTEKLNASEKKELRSLTQELCLVIAKKGG